MQFKFATIAYWPIFGVLLALAACGGGGGGGGNSATAENNAVTAPAIEVQTQSAYAASNQPLSTVVNQVQQSYQTNLQNGQ
jgi:hypothetical protein